MLRGCRLSYIAFHHGLSRHVTKILERSTLRLAEKCAAGSWGRSGRSRTRSGDGEGWGRDREREFLSFVSAQKRPQVQLVARQAGPRSSGLIAPGASRSGSQFAPTTGSAVPDYRG